MRWPARRPDRKTISYTVRWTVAGREKSKTFRTSAQANNWLSDLRQAAKKGELFDLETGLPQSVLKAKEARTVYAFVSAYVDALTKERPGRPDAEILRAALRKYALLPEARRRPDVPLESKQALRWLEGASLDLTDLNETKTVRLALDALALRLDGKAASANTIRRKRAVLSRRSGVRGGAEGAARQPRAQGQVEATQDHGDGGSAGGDESSSG